MIIEARRSKYSICVSRHRIAKFQSSYQKLLVFYADLNVSGYLSSICPWQMKPTINIWLISDLNLLSHGFMCCAYYRVVH